MDAAAIEAGLRAAVPFNSTLGVEYDEISADTAVLRLPDDPRLHNHVGGPHAGAMFSLGEAASGAVVLANFADVLARATPLAASAEIAYKRLARGEVTARAVVSRAAAEVLAELDSGATPRFPVHVTLSDTSGTTTAEMTVTWALKPNG